ncbi:MAG TPA: hypothetical protein VGJ09_12890, partial [Bryobacteraceae bacterium]
MRIKKDRHIARPLAAWALGAAIAGALGGAVFQDRLFAADPATQPASRPSRAPGDMMSRAADSGSLVYVDDSFASVEKLRAAINYAKQGQAQLAITSYQDIVDKFG